MDVDGTCLVFGKWSSKVRSMFIHVHPFFHFRLDRAPVLAPGHAHQPRLARRLRAVGARRGQELQALQAQPPQLLGATLLGAPGIATRNKKLLGAKHRY